MQAVGKHAHGCPEARLVMFLPFEVNDGLAPLPHVLPALESSAAAMTRRV